MSNNRSNSRNDGDNIDQGQFDSAVESNRNTIEDRLPRHTSTMNNSSNSPTHKAQYSNKNINFTSHHSNNFVSFDPLRNKYHTTPSPLALPSYHNSHLIDRPHGSNNNNNDNNNNNSNKSTLLPPRPPNHNPVHKREYIQFSGDETDLVPDGVYSPDIYLSSPHLSSLFYLFLVTDDTLADLTCRMCVCLLDKPMTLPCSHAFCTACLGEFIANQKEQKKHQLFFSHLF